MEQKPRPRVSALCPRTAILFFMLTIDGSLGEGGGQILRTALSLSLVTRREFCIGNIRAGRPKPGLQSQHLASVKAAAMVGQAEVEGAEIGSQSLKFRPRQATPGEYTFSVGTAGSATLVLQTVLPALLMVESESALILEGGTHNPMAPPFEFLVRAYLPLIHRMGPVVKAKLDRHGFYPAGGGRLRVTVEPSAKLGRLGLPERGEIKCCRATAVVANLPRHIAERELKVLKRKLSLERDDLHVQEVKSQGPGNVALVEVEAANVTEVFSSFGERGVPAEVVSARLAKEVCHYLESGVSVGRYLADQLLLPMALAGGGSFATLPLSSHALTNIEVLKMFLPLEVKFEPASCEVIHVEVERAS